MHHKISDALMDNKHFWKEMRKLGLLPTTDKALHGFSPKDLSTHFLSISNSLLEDSTVSYNTISTTNLDGFSFRPVIANDVILAVAHFKSQARGEDGIPHLIVAEALPIIARHLAKLVRMSLARGVFSSSRKIARLENSIAENSPQKGSHTFVSN